MEKSEIQELIERVKIAMLNNYGDKIMSYAEELRREGMAAGMQHGMAAGMQHGMAAGMHEAAKNMLVSGINIDTICSCTGLSKTELQKMQAETSDHKDTSNKHSTTSEQL